MKKGVCRCLLAAWGAQSTAHQRFSLITSEPDQALAALDEADLEEILDHHRLGNASTRMPIRFTVDVVGSTSTLVAERIYAAGLSAPPVLAGLLLAGLISGYVVAQFANDDGTRPRYGTTVEPLGIGAWFAVGR